MTSWDDPHLAGDMRTVAGQFDTATLQAMCAELTDEIKRREAPVSESAALGVLSVLQDKRHIALVHDIAEALLKNGTGGRRVVHRYALALLDHDRIAVAEALLEGLPAQDRAEGEVAGALGRVHKQRYLTSGAAGGDARQQDLVTAIETYAAAYGVDKRRFYYQGINTATLLARAARDEVTVPGHDNLVSEARRIAQDILDEIEDESQQTMWHYATAAEACLLLERHDQAIGWVGRYVASNADAFEFASTMRQLELVWELDTDTAPGDEILPLLRNRLLQAEGGEIRVTPDELTVESLERFERVDATLRRAGGDVYEKVFGSDRFKSPKWLRHALDTCRSIALIQKAYDDEGVGTGFVLAGRDIRDDWPELVLLTNFHVIPEGIPRDAARINFLGLDDDSGDNVVEPPLGEPLFTSEKDELDVCVLALPDELVGRVVPLRVRLQFPDLASRPRAYVIGYPKGSPFIQVSLHDTLLLGSEGRYAHYRSPTEPGSSGSPVFDEEWQVIALHHRSVATFPGSTKPANEGVRIDALTEAFERDRHADRTPGDP